MRLIDIFILGFGNLLRRKLRTFLTVLGVIIGAASIITMLSLGFGMKEALRSQLGGAGSLTMIQVNESYEYSEISMGGGRGVAVVSSSSSSRSERPTLNAEAIKNFAALDHVVAVSPERSAYLRIVCGKLVGDVSVTGVDAAQMENFGFDLEAGQLLTPGEDGLVFGHYALYNFYDPRRQEWANFDDSQPPPVDVLAEGKVSLTFDHSYGNRRQYSDASQTAAGGGKPKLYKAKAVGVLDDDNWNYTWNVYMDINALNKIIKDNDKLQGAQSGGQQRSGRDTEEKYDLIRVKVDEVENVLAVQDVIKNMGYQPYSDAEYLNSVEGTYNTIQLVLGGIGAVSLLVAAIGITNTMIMSIYERTREIGVMKVIGAAIYDIRTLFLLESAIIGLMGGLLGVGLSYLLSRIINTLAASSESMGGAVDKISIIPPWLVLAALGVSSLVGLVSGYLPARRAMKLSALDAIRAE
ncbi:MAG: ABC transporter permease [Gracilibacteraceae bacterium]|jgi:ABC-type antimicrobial peptide transport system permease subunit|nr:ABC transporter permease [Gracilibacteraceae bacterium]